MRRSFQKREGELLNEVTELKSVIMQLRAEVRTKEQAHTGAHERNLENLKKNEDITADVNQLQESTRILKKVKERDDSELSRLKNRIAQMQEVRIRAGCDERSESERRGC